MNYIQAICPLRPAQTSITLRFMPISYNPTPVQEPPYNPYSISSNARHGATNNTVSGVVSHNESRRGSVSSSYSGVSASTELGSLNLSSRYPGQIGGDHERLPPMQTRRGASQDTRTQHGRRPPYELSRRSNMNTSTSSSRRNRPDSDGSGNENKR